MVGKIKSMVYSQSFGFIRGKDKEEYFFRFDDVKGQFEHMHRGVTVSFDPVKTDEKNPRAINIVPDEYVKPLVLHRDELPGGKGWYWVLLPERDKAVPGFWNGEYWSNISTEVGWQYIYPAAWMRMDFPRKGEWA